VYYVPPRRQVLLGPFQFPQARQIESGFFLPVLGFISGTITIKFNWQIIIISRAGPMLSLGHWLARKKFVKIRQN